MHHAITQFAGFLTLACILGYIIYEIVSGFEIGKKEKKGVDLTKYRKEFDLNK